MMIARSVLAQHELGPELFGVRNGMGLLFETGDDRCMLAQHHLSVVQQYVGVPTLFDERR